MIKISVNGKDHSLDVSPETPLLWVIREHLKLTGTKFGCGKGLCGCCTVHVNGKAERSCQIPVSRAAGREILTIEGIPDDHPLKRSWIEEDVPQCGYCQPGQIMQAADLLKKNPSPGSAEIDQAMSGNLCRCGTYQGIRRAIRKAAEMKKEGGKS